MRKTILFLCRIIKHIDLFVNIEYDSVYNRLELEKNRCQQLLQKKTNGFCSAPLRKINRLHNSYVTLCD